MTLIDIKNQIVSHFTSNDTFLLERDGVKIKIPKDLEPAKDALIKTSMKDFEDSKVVKYIEGVGWILDAPIGANGQQVEISLPCAHVISQTIGAYAKANKELEIESIDTLNITEKDIWIMLRIIHELLQDETEGAENG
jgi:hypothetical protein